MEKTKERNVDRLIAELTHKLNLYDFEEILDVAIEQIPMIVQSQRVSIYLHDNAREYLVPKRHSSGKLKERTLEKIPVDSKHSLIPHVLNKREATLILNVQDYIKKRNLPITLSKRQRYTSGSCILAPIHVHLPNERKKCIGILNFTEKKDFMPFSKYDLHLANHISEILGTALHNCTVVEKKLGGQQKQLMSELSNMKEAFAQKDIKLEEAKKKQSMMLPELPVIPDYDVDVYYSPMETIGGDFYDFIKISDDEIGIVIGDVSGHGIEAAMVMSMAKQVLNIYSKLYPSLTETLAHANEEIFSTLQGDSFIAVFLGILNTQTHVLRYARAGQTYPLIFNSQRQADPFELRSSGVVVGTVRRQLFRSKIEEKYIQFRPGDVLLLYTDGVIEANNADEEEFGVERLMETLQNSATNSAQQINRGLQQIIDKFTQRQQMDDITLLTLKVGDIQVSTNFDTQRVQKEMLKTEALILTPELSYGEDVHYQMLNLEQKITDLETQLEHAQQEKDQLSIQCQELNDSLDLAADIPESYVKSLRDQLKIALELPRDLIQENNRLHQEIKEKQQELSDFELEFNELVSQLDLKQIEYQKLQQKIQDKNDLQDQILQYAEQLRCHLLQDETPFDKKILDFLKEEDYMGALEQLGRILSLAMEQMDMAAVNTLQQQLFSISMAFAKIFRDMHNLPAEGKIA